jgi:hypothetical protein
MNTISIRAHYDGEEIRLDEPFQLEPNSELIVTVLPKSVREPERDDWLRLSGARLEDAYRADEPDYSPDMIREANPDYEGR